VLLALPLKETVLFGHSLGASIAFETARLLEPHAAARHLVVSGKNAPRHREDRDWMQQDLLDYAECNQLLPPALRNDRAAADLYLRVLRADLALELDYQFRPGVVLSCPISSIVAREDATVSYSKSVAWGEVTKVGLRLVQCPGTHQTVLGQGCLLAVVKEALDGGSPADRSCWRER
jgi:surfactin synthase thioesterase subunit